MCLQYYLFDTYVDPYYCCYYSYDRCLRIAIVPDIMATTIVSIIIVIVAVVWCCMTVAVMLFVSSCLVVHVHALFYLSSMHFCHSLAQDLTCTLLHEASILATGAVATLITAITTNNFDVVVAVIIENRKHWYLCLLPLMMTL